MLIQLTQSLYNQGNVMCKVYITANLDDDQQIVHKHLNK